MNTRQISTAFFNTLFALPLLVATASTSSAHAGPQRVEQLPRVVIAGKSLDSKAAQQVVTLPRVVVLGRRSGDTQVASCRNNRAAESVQASTQQC